MIESRLVIDRARIIPGPSEMIEIDIRSNCIRVDDEFEVDEIELVRFNEKEWEDFLPEYWKKFLEPKVQSAVWSDGALIAQIYEDCINER